jgi:hypothetical protein
MVGRTGVAVLVVGGKSVEVGGCVGAVAGVVVTGSTCDGCICACVPVARAVSRVTPAGALLQAGNNSVVKSKNTSIRLTLAVYHNKTPSQAIIN